jgi:PAS domain S-box-containing protein
MRIDSSHESRTVWKQVSWPQTSLLSVLVALLSYFVLRIEGDLMLHPQTMWPLWPGCALLVSVLLFVPRRAWLALIPAAFAAFAVYDLQAGVPIGSIAWFIPADAAEIFVAAFGLSYFFAGPPRLTNLKNLGKYLLCAVILAPSVAAFLAAPGIHLSYWNGWSTCFLSEVLAFLTLPPAILGWAKNRPALLRESLGRLEGAMLLVGVVLLSYLSLIVANGSNSPAFLYALVPFLLWSALRFGMTGTSSAVIVVAFFALWGEAHRRGPFIESGHLGNLLSIQLFLIFTAIPFMVLAAVAHERADTEAALRKREADLLEAQRVAQVGSWQWDPKSDRAVWSAELYRITGQEPSLTPPRYQEQTQLYVPESWERLQRAVRETMRNGTPYKLDLEILRPDGTRRWISDRGEALSDASGRITALRGTAQDITERKQAEEALRESEERFRTMFRNAGVGMVIVSPAGRFLAANNAFCDYLGYTEEELLQKTVQSITLTEDWPELLRKLTETLEHGTTLQRIEKRCLHKSGRVLTTESSASWIRGTSDEPLYLIGTALDVTERRHAEEALAGVSSRLIEAHEEERTWIARELHDDISQQIAMLAVDLEDLKRKLPPSAGMVSQGLADVGHQVSSLGSDVQALSHRLHSSKLEYLGIAAAAAGFCKELSEKQGVEINFHSEGLPKNLSQDISLCLFRVLQEALQNAVKHSGSQHLEVSLLVALNAIQLIVRDSGIGFDFNEAMKGRGVGLSSMRERLKLVGGKFSIESQPQQGTTIHARVPLSCKMKSAGAGE